MQIYFDPETHTYTIDGVEVPSVTTVCRFLSYDQKSDKPWLAKEAADRGTRIHAACAAIDYGIDPEETEDIAGYLKAYRRFLKDYRPDWEGIEYTTGSAELGLAGTIDRFGTIVLTNSAPLASGSAESSQRSVARPLPTATASLGCGGAPHRVSCILDIKTGSKLHDAPLRAQLTGYYWLLQARFNAKYMYALQLSKDGTYTMVDVRQDSELLNACIFIHNAVRRKIKHAT